MIFQILDDKKDCLGLFSGGEFYYGHIKRSFEKTWDWSPHLFHDDYEYARIWCGGKTLEEAREIKNKDIANALDLPPIKIHCSVLAEDSIHKAIEDYESKL